MLAVGDDRSVAHDTAGLCECGARRTCSTAPRDRAPALLGDGARSDVALRDLSLKREGADSTAAALITHAVPFVFASGSDKGGQQGRHAQAAPWDKPPGAAALARPRISQPGPAEAGR